MKETLWTIQHEKVYEVFQRTGFLRANNDDLFCKDELRFAYKWMSKQMCLRIGPPPTGVQYPLWAWYQWEGHRSRRDLRCSGYAPRGTPLVQIEFEVDTENILKSDFDDWNFVLNNDFIADSEKEFEYPKPILTPF